MPNATNTPPDHISLLLKRVGQSDAVAFDVLYDQVSAKLLGVVLRIIPERAQAEDVLHDSFVKIWKSASQFDPVRASAMAWMATIARNTAIDRKRKRTEVSLDDDPMAMAIDRWSMGSAQQGADELRLTVAACLDRLSDHHREAVLLAYCEGYSREELAARFETPVNTIKTWLRRGLQALKECVVQ